MKTAHRADRCSRWLRGEGESGAAVRAQSTLDSVARVLHRPVACCSAHAPSDCAGVSYSCSTRPPRRRGT